MYAKTIRSVSFAKAWEEAVKFVRKSPEKLTFGRGKEVKHAVDSQCTIILDEHAVRDVLNHVVHPSDPFATPLKLKEYIAEYTDEYDASRFDYTYYNIHKEGYIAYGTCLTNPYNIPFNQIEALRFGLDKQCKERLSSNRNVAVLYNPVIHTYSDKAQPCWNEVMVRWKCEGQAQIYWTFRSHDLFSAWEGNTVAITEFLNREVVKPCGCEIVEICEFNYSLHIYDYDLPKANEIKILQINPALQRLQNKYDRIDNPTIFDEYLESRGL
ncbi:MAG: hypothetical protein Q7T55_09625 [Solirubrobacteraceae bacterium]|nr:hypothetical protein [Solirubrobacteraceae bacterium]